MGFFNKIKKNLKRDDKNQTNPKIDYEVYISYNFHDQKVADEIATVFKDNGISCWMSDSSLATDELIRIIEKAKIMVIILSNNYMTSSFNEIETKTAISLDMRPVVFSIDECDLTGIFEYFLSRQHILRGYPNPRESYAMLIEVTSWQIGKDISNPILNLPEDKSSSNPPHSNFRYLDDLIHKEGKNIILDRDIIFDEDDIAEPIMLDVDDIVIDGDGHSIDAKSRTGIFLTVAKGITLKNLKLTNAFSKRGGAAIHNYKGKIKLINVCIDANTSKFQGGGIYNGEGEIELSDCELVNNISQNDKGSAIYNDGGKISVNDTIFNNDTSNGENIMIYVGKGLINIADSVICDNITKGNLIYNQDTLTANNIHFKNNLSRNIISNCPKSTLTLYRCEFKDNELTEATIFNCGKYCSISKTNFENSSSRYCILNKTEMAFKKVETDNFDMPILNSGVILLDDSAGDFDDIIENQGTVKRNIIPDEEKFDFTYLDRLIHSAQSKEIVLKEDILLGEYESDYYEGGIELDVDNLTIDGGGITISGNFKSRIFIVTGKNITLKNITFENGSMSENYDSSFNNYGGAIQNNSKSNLAIENCIFKNNASEKQGGAISNRGNIIISDCNFSNNMAYEGSGAIYNRKGILEITNTMFRKNNVDDNQLGLYCYGGAINNLKDAIIKINFCEITHTSLEGFRGYGGAIHNHGKLEIAHSILSNNTSQRNGGMLYNDRGYVKISKCNISNNVALTGDGGALYNRHGRIEISDCRLSENHARFDGGAIHNGDEISILECELYDNSVEIRHGGAVYNKSKGMINDCILKGNVAGESGAIWTSDSGFVIGNCRFSNNRPNDIERYL